MISPELDRQWQCDYKSKVATAEEAVSCIKSGDSLYIHSNAAAPVPLLDALARRASSLNNVRIYHIVTLGNAEYAKPEYAKAFRIHALFIGANVRQAVNEGRADYTPVFLSDIPGMILSDVFPVDVCLLQVSPPDAHGYCSYGVSVDCTLAARKKAKIVIAEVNKQMPRTLGRSFVHVSRLDKIIETDRPLPQLEIAASGEVEQAIGKYVSELIPDKATLQLGIGAIPNAVLSYLTDKKDLGIHSEMLSDGVVDLIEKGVITNDAKTVLPGKVAVSFVMGTKKLYNFVDNNPLVEFQTTDFINDPFVIAQNYMMHSINSALQIDLGGQVSSDSVGNYLYSGFGGQVDFVRGASRSKGGKAIIALPSTAQAGKVSRIVADLTAGSGVVTSRADVHYVVTEYGICQLYGKNLAERARDLINIAHPQFRAELEEKAAQKPWLKGHI